VIIRLIEENGVVAIEVYALEIKPDLILLYSI
jgi:hypothetical protein